MNPEHLRTFLAVCKHRNFTRAAEQRFISQPAVSRQIQQLERGLGVALFEHIGKSLHLTDAGRTLVREARRLLADLDRVAESVAGHQSAATGRLRIGAGTTPGFCLLPPILGRFHQAYPGVELHYTVDNSETIEQKILGNELDLGFVGAPSSNSHILAKPIAEDEIICFTSPTHALASRKRISPKALERETWIVRRRGSATRELFEKWLADAGGVVGATIELGCPEAVRSLVVAGIGFGYMSVLAVAAELRDKRVTRLPVTGLQLRRSILQIRHVDKHVSPVLQVFLSMVDDSLSAPRAEPRVRTTS